MSTMKSAQTVYYGPSASTYPSVGSVSSNETVTACWKEGTWMHIEYSVTGTSNKKRGYVPAATVNITEYVSTITNQNLTRYVNTSSTTYTGPAASGYASAGSVTRGEAVKYIGQKINNYAFIEYNITGSSQKKRAYINANYLSTTAPSGGLTVGSRPSDMNINGPAYMSNINIYYAAGYQGQCTWFCWGRTYEKTGKRLSFNGSNNGGEWYDHINTSNVTKRAASGGPVTNSICSCSGSTSAGHVIFVELVDGDTVYYTEANVGGTDGIVKSCAKSSFPPNRTAYGYIVL